jgi:hypothetical protein
MADLIGSRKDVSPSVLMTADGQVSTPISPFAKRTTSTNFTWLPFKEIANEAHMKKNLHNTVDTLGISSTNMPCEAFSNSTLDSLNAPQLYSNNHTLNKRALDTIKIDSLTENVPPPS